MLFGIKRKRLQRFGRKARKYGLFALKTGGKIATIAGAATAQPELVAAGSASMALGEGLEKL